ncbi:hypothetical protein HGRIS_009122 [Hohenbuehelia grisea]|uniref:Uncharacterized protein n=1 Tax=Hohenbuehelia grisea TaxID=104357 RepID=A0ABR3J068_9AGAR
MPDSFANCSNFSIHGGTFTNVAGNQTVTTYNYHLAPFHSIGPNRLPSLPLPSTSPYQELLHVIIEIQRALSPLEDLYSDARSLASLFGPLKAQLDELFQSAACVGSIVELLEIITTIDRKRPFPDYLFVQVKSRVAHYASALTMFLSDIKRYREGLRDTAFGPSWLRILWFILRAASDPGIEAILSDMKTEVDQFQTPLKQFIATVHMMHLDIDWHWLTPAKQEVIRILLGTLKSGHPLFKDVVLDFVTVVTVDSVQSIKVPLLWCSSMQDVAAILLKTATVHVTLTPSTELLPSNPCDSSFASISPDTTVKSALVAYGVVFYNDIPSLCPACRTSLDPGITPCISWVECRYCRMEYSLRKEEYSRRGGVTGQPPPWALGDRGSSFSDITAFHFPRLFQDTYEMLARSMDLWKPLAPDHERRSMYHIPLRTSVRFSQSWEHLIGSQVITGLTGELPYLISVLETFFRLRSPLQRCSVNLRPPSDTVNSNIFIPGAVLNLVPRPNLSPSIPALTHLSVNMWFNKFCGSFQDSGCRLTGLEQISIPSLEYFCFNSRDGFCQTCYTILESFLLRNRSLQTLRLEISHDHNGDIPIIFDTFIRRIIPVQSNLLSLTIRCIPGYPLGLARILSNPSMLRRIYTAWKETRRATATTECRLVDSVTLQLDGDMTSSYYPSPWVFPSIVADDGPESPVYHECLYVVEISLDKLDDCIGFGIDAYDIFASFLLSRPFDHPELEWYGPQIHPTPSESGSADILTYEFSRSTFLSDFPSYNY